MSWAVALLAGAAAQSLHPRLATARDAGQQSDAHAAPTSPDAGAAPDTAPARDAAGDHPRFPATGRAPVLTRAPRLKRPPVPVYPTAALAGGVSADVVLQIDIDALGAVTNAVVTQPAGQGFDESALAAARTLEFEPAEIDGRPGAIRISFTLRFRPPGGTVDGGSDGGVPTPAAADGGAATDTARTDVSLPPTQILARGRLRERGTRDPIAGAEVTVARLSAGAAAVEQPLTGNDGEFTVTAAPGERVRLVVSSAAHEPCIRELALPFDPATPLDVTCLVARHGRVYESVVEAPKRGDEITRYTLSQPELTSVPGTFGDPLRAIQNLPGIARSPYGLGLLLIRGANPQDSGVYIDGHRVPLLYHFAVGPSVLTPDLIDRIDFFPGGFGVRYGRATAGVIDVTTRTTPRTRVHGAADVDFLDAGLYLEGPVGGGWSASAAARRSYVDTLLPAVLPDSETVAAPVYWDYQARISRDTAPGRTDQLSLFAFGSSDTLDVISEDPERGDIDLGAHVSFHRLIGTWTRPLGSSGWVSRLSPAYGYDSVGFRAGMVNATGSAHVLGLREDLQRPLGATATLALGFDGELRFDRVDFNVPVRPERRTYGRTMRPITEIGRTFANVGTAGYLELLWDLRPGLRLSPGIRFDYFHYSDTDKTAFDPRVVLRWAPGATAAEPAGLGTTFKTGVGIFHQPPSPVQLDGQFGNPRLPLIWADQYHLGIEQSLATALSLDATLYYLRRHDMPVTSSRQDASGGAERYAGDGRARSYGMELLLKHRPTNTLSGWVAYTLSRSELGRRPSADGAVPSAPYRPTEFDQTHNLIAVVSRKLGAWELGSRFRLVTGIPETPVLGAFYDSDYNDWDPVSGAARSVRRQTFHQLDLRAERTFTFASWIFSVYLDVQNVYNAENPEATIHDYRFEESGPVRGLPVLPILGVRGRF